MSAPGDGSAAVPSEPRRWTIYVCERHGVEYPTYNAADDEIEVCPCIDEAGERKLRAVTVEEVGPVSEARAAGDMPYISSAGSPRDKLVITEAQVEAGARALVEQAHITTASLHSDTSSVMEDYRDAARAVLSAAREVKSDG